MREARVAHGREVGGGDGALPAGQERGGDGAGSARQGGRGARLDRGAEPGQGQAFRARLDGGAADGEAAAAEAREEGGPLKIVGAGIGGRDRGADQGAHGEHLARFRPRRILVPQPDAERRAATPRRRRGAGG